MGLDGLSYTAVTPRASLKSDANNIVENMAKEINDNKLHLLEVRCAASLSIKSQLIKSLIRLNS